MSLINITTQLGVIEISPGWLGGLIQSLRNFTQSAVRTFFSQLQKLATNSFLSFDYRHCVDVGKS